MTILTSARLRFEPFEARHFDGLQAMNADPEVMRYISGRPETPNETRAAIARVQARWAEYGYDWWALVERDSGELVGAAGLQHVGQDRSSPIEIGWRLRRDRWGQGLATEAAREILRHAFEALAAPRVCAIRHPDNLASQRVMEGLGMRPIGRLPWQDMEVEVYDLARADWNARPRVHRAPGPSFG